MHMISIHKIVEAFNDILYFYRMPKSNMLQWLLPVLIVVDPQNRYYFNLLPAESSAQTPENIF